MSEAKKEYTNNLRFYTAIETVSKEGPVKCCLSLLLHHVFVKTQPTSGVTTLLIPPSTNHLPTYDSRSEAILASSQLP
jgi:hypothetical protein